MKSITFHSYMLKCSPLSPRTIIFRLPKQTVYSGSTLKCTFDLADQHRSSTYFWVQHISREASSDVFECCAHILKMMPLCVRRSTAGINFRSAIYDFLQQSIMLMRLIVLSSVQDSIWVLCVCCFVILTTHWDCCIFCICSPSAEISMRRRSCSIKCWIKSVRTICEWDCGHVFTTQTRQTCASRSVVCDSDMNNTPRACFWFHGTILITVCFYNIWCLFCSMNLQGNLQVPLR